jgi:RNA polymerase sigma-70 factor (ECF subfamily)
MSGVPSSAFDQLVASHERQVLRLCRAILRDDHLGADAAQETFLRLWRRITSGRAPDRSPAWLRRVAVTTSLDLARRRAQDARETGDVDDVASGDHAAEIAARDVELRGRFEAALAELPEGQRTVFLLRHDGGLALSEVAETLDVSLPTVKTQFARACLKLQAKLAAFAPDEENRS